MPELVSIFKELGTTTAVWLIIAYIVIRHLVPYWKERDTRREAFRENQWNRIQSFQEGVVSEMTEAIKRLSNYLEALTLEIKRRRNG